LSATLAKKTLRDVPAAGRTVLVRVDFNVPLQGQRIVDDTRITAALPTIRHLCAAGAKVVLCSHLGRPQGRRVHSLSLRPIAAHLEHVLGQPVAFSADTVGPRARRAALGLGPGGVVLLENTRFYPEEERNDPVFAKALAGLADLFVQDAFGAVHRAHASTAGVTRYLPAVAGFLVEREIAGLGRLLDAEPPFVAVIGGAKVSDKIGVLASLLERVDRLLIGGGMANTFLAALGHGTGRSLVEADQLPAAEHRPGGPGAAGVDGAGHRPAYGRTLRRRLARRAHRVLERSVGCGRVAEFRGRHCRRRAGRGRLRRLHGGRGRRLDGCTAAPRPRGPHRAPEHRRGRLPGIPGGPSAARHRLSGGLLVRLVAGNWKAHGTAAEAASLCRALDRPPPGVYVVICPPHTALDAVRRHLPEGIRMGAQDLFWEDRGAFTGAVTGPMLAEAGVTHVIVAHSERRRYFGETDETAARKLQACWRNGLVPILCVGETLEQREAGHTAAVLRAQVVAALRGSGPATLCVAYEPIWAIGTGRAASPRDCAEGLAAIRAALGSAWPDGGASAVACLYGGSVSPSNCAGFWGEGSADGALVGGASLDAQAFSAICRAAGGDVA
jgi:triosephosphate isomerase